MKKSISVNKKTARGRPKKVGGSYPVTAVRLPPDVLASVDIWAARHGAGRSEAIRRLVEIGLKAKAK
jgi:ribbon-helix-helix CopG family protein